jgi:hypothetical protein
MEPDEQLIFAVQRVQTGAEIHKLNNLLHQYMCACFVDDRSLAEHTQQKLMAFVGEKNRERNKNRRVMRVPARC